MNQKIYRYTIFIILQLNSTILFSPKLYISHCTYFLTLFLSLFIFLSLSFVWVIFFCIIIFLSLFSILSFSSIILIQFSFPLLLVIIDVIKTLFLYLKEENFNYVDNEYLFIYLFMDIFRSRIVKLVFLLKLFYWKFS